LQDDPLDTVLQDRNVEINEQSRTNGGHPEVTQKLSAVELGQAFDRLDLQDQLVVDDEVQSLMAQHLTAIDDRV
jgi:hypothetical protein